MSENKSKEKTKGAKEPEIYYFASMMCPGFGAVISIISKTSYTLWLTKECKIILHRPRSIKVVPDMNNPSVSIMYVTPPSPIKTPQETIPARVDAVEILSEVNKDGSSLIRKEDEHISKNIRHLFSDYLKSLEQWTISLSELVIPGAGEGVALADNVIPLEPGRLPPR